MSTVARSALAVCLFLLTRTVLCWKPFYAAPFTNLPSLPLVGATLLLAVVAALTGRDRRPRRIRPLVLTGLAAGVALFITIYLRGLGGIPCDVYAPKGFVCAAPARTSGNRPSRLRRSTSTTALAGRVARQSSVSESRRLSFMDCRRR